MKRRHQSLFVLVLLFLFTPFFASAQVRALVNVAQKLNGKISLQKILNGAKSSVRNIKGQHFLDESHFNPRYLVKKTRKGKVTIYKSNHAIWLRNSGETLQAAQKRYHALMTEIIDEAHSVVARLKDENLDFYQSLKQVRHSFKGIDLRMRFSQSYGRHRYDAIIIDFKTPGKPMAKFLETHRDGHVVETLTDAGSIVIGVTKDKTFFQLLTAYGNLRKSSLAVTTVAMLSAVSQGKAQDGTDLNYFDYNKFTYLPKLLQLIEQEDPEAISLMVEYQNLVKTFIDGETTRKFHKQMQEQIESEINKSSNIAKNVGIFVFEVAVGDFLYLLFGAQKTGMSASPLPLNLNWEDTKDKIEDLACQLSELIAEGEKSEADQAYKELSILFYEMTHDAPENQLRSF